MNERKKVNQLYWMNPSSKRVFPAGVAYYNTEYGEFYLKVDEEPSEKQYYLKPEGTTQGQVVYRMDLVIKSKEGKFLKRQKVGEGIKDDTTDGQVYIDFGSKYKTLVLDLETL